MKIFIEMFLLMNIFIYNETNYEMFKFRKLNEKMPDELQKCSKLLMLLFFISVTIAVDAGMCWYLYFRYWVYLGKKKTNFKNKKELFNKYL